MQADNSILFVSAVLLSALYIYFYFKPLKLTELTGKTYAAFLGASIALLVLILDGIFLFAALNMVFMVVVITIQRLPVLRFVEPHNGNGSVMINHVVDRYHWPAIASISYHGRFRTGKFLGIFNWTDVIAGFQYIYQGKTYQSLRDFERAHPTKIGVAEDALSKALEVLK